MQVIFRKNRKNLLKSGKVLPKKGMTAIEFAGIVILCILVAWAVIRYGDAVLHFGQAANSYTMGTGWEREDYSNIDAQNLDEDRIDHFFNQK